MTLVVTDEMIAAAIEAAWPGPEVVYSDHFDSAEAMMRAAIEGALNACTAPDTEEWNRRNTAFHEALRKYPHSHYALHYLWNAAIAAGPETAKEPLPPPLS